MRSKPSQTLAVGIGMLCALIGYASLGASPAKQDVLIVHVSLRGNDKNDGSEQKPLASLEAAKDKARQIRHAHPGKSVQIVIEPGLYVRSKPFELVAEDGGTESAPVTYNAAKPGTVTIFGGQTVALSSFAPVTDVDVIARFDEAARGKVVALKLDPTFTATGPYPDTFRDHGGLAQVFCDGQRMPIARWPAEGYAAMDGVVDSGIEPKRGGTFHYSGDRPPRWAGSLKSGGLWLVGYWRVPWETYGIKVASMDADAKTITFAAAIPQGIGSKYTSLVNGTRAGDRSEPWFAINVLEEIVKPGQWCIDSSTRTLYFWPPESAKPDTRVLLAEGQSSLLSVKGASHLKLENLTFEGSLGSAVSIDAADDVSLVGCTVRHTGGVGIVTTNATRLKVQSCDVYDTGSEGLRIAGGDRMKLLPSQIEVANNHVHHTGRIAQGAYAIEIDGVGVRVHHNLVHDTPLGAIQFRGNDHLFENNEIHNIGLEGGDLGGFYTNGDWAARGNVVRNNLVHHAPNANGVYFDDGNSGSSAIGNTFYKCRSGIFIGGGHDNVGTGNLVVDCQIGLHLDDRGLARNYTIDSKGALTKVLRTLEMTAEPWKSRYPQMLESLSHPESLPRPTGNRITENSVVACKTLSTFPTTEISAQENHLEPNQAIDSIDGLFAAAEKLEFAPAGGAPALLATGERSGFGLQTDAWRTTLPTAEATGRLESRPPRVVFKSEVDVDASNRAKGH